MPTLDELAAIPIADGGGMPSLVAATAAPGIAATDVHVTTVSHDSRTVGEGTLFACLRGASFDGHEFAARAVEAGAVALLVDHELSEEAARGAPQLVVPDTRAQLGPLAAAIEGHPSRALTTVGITGTNGKTTTAAMIATIFEANDWSTGVLGTLTGVRTTPEAPELQQQLAGFVRAGKRAAVLEVSSHALALHRVDGTSFDAVVFTNLGRDHLDLHGTPELYFRAKASLFSSRFAPLAVINVDDSHGRLLADTLEAGPAPAAMRVIEVAAADLEAIEVGATAHSYRWRGLDVEVPIGGDFNVANSHAALLTAVELGVPADVAVAGLGRLAPIAGRFEPVRASPAPDFTVIVDYAHTPDGLAELIGAARAGLGDESSVIVVFGCGGERDHAKRAEMGAIASAGADRVVVTSDNPRHEDPRQIVDQILSGVPAPRRDRVTAELDRRRAIEQAIDAARTGDVVLIAGKGHERVQDLGDRTIEFDDRAVAAEILASSTTGRATEEEPS